MDAKRLNRRQFITATCTTAAVAMTGIEGIVAARRAPAYAQGTKLHWVRWVDFIPESDVEPSSAHVGGLWLAVPHSIIGNAVAYRRSWLREAGAHEYPKTWDEARKLFAQLKQKGKPYGQTLGHTFGDAPTFCYPMLWCFGGAETDKTGKKVVLNGKGAIESVKFMQAFWKECCDEGGL